jgi:hypothetical protein
MDRKDEEKIRLWGCFCIHTMKPFFRWKRDKETKEPIEKIKTPFLDNNSPTKSRIKNWLHERLIKKTLYEAEIWLSNEGHQN